MDDFARKVDLIEELFYHDSLRAEGCQILYEGPIKVKEAELYSAARNRGKKTQSELTPSFSGIFLWHFNTEWAGKVLHRRRPQ